MQAYGFKDQIELFFVGPRKFSSQLPVITLLGMETIRIPISMLLGNIGIGGGGGGRSSNTNSSFDVCKDLALSEIGNSYMISFLILQESIPSCSRNQSASNLFKTCSNWLKFFF